MCWSWIDFARGYINIPSEATKNGKSRSIPVNQVVRDVLSGLQLTAGRNALLFVSHKTGGMLQDVKKGFRAACNEAELVDFRFHDLRHTAGTRLGDTGADPFVIAEVLGHSDLKMTKRYTHATDQRKRAALERIATYGRDNELRLAERNCHKIVTKRRAEGWVTFRKFLCLEGEQRGLNPRPPDPQSGALTN